MTDDVILITLSPLLKLKPDPRKKNKFLLVDSETGEEHEHHKGLCPGVYVWGFLSEKDPHRFIPYYVGEAVDSILARIHQHKKDIENAGSTYIRLTKEYMTESEKSGKPPYWYDEDFPPIIHNGISHLWCSNHCDDKVTFWSKRDGEEKGIGEYCIDNSINRADIDHLCQSGVDGILEFDFGGAAKIVPDGTFKLKDSFRLFYWDIFTGYQEHGSGTVVSDTWQDNSKTKRYFLETFEAFFKYTLLGKTIGSAISVQSMHERNNQLFYPPINLRISQQSLCREYFSATAMSEMKQEEIHQFNNDNPADPYLTNVKASELSPQLNNA